MSNVVLFVSLHFPLRRKNVKKCSYSFEDQTEQEDVDLN